MSFKIDKQTLDDLSIFGRRSENSVCGIFSHTTTHGGAKILEEFLISPSDDLVHIRERSDTIRYYLEYKIPFPYQGEWFDAAEYYLTNIDSRSQLIESEINIKRKLNQALGADTEFEQLHNGIRSLIQIIDTTYKLLERLPAHCPAYESQVQALSEIVHHPNLAAYAEDCSKKRLSFERAAYWDKIFRFSLRNELMKLLDLIYRADAYCSVARVCRERGFTFAQVEEADSNLLEFDQMYHPLLKNAKANSLTVQSPDHMIFLTGANMAGKSTFMKSFGIAVYLAHCGLPVAARSFRISVRSGLYTTINLPDNLNAGYSHFYAEVLRLKKVSQEVVASGHLVVIFDELFRGTNVKDAYDATVAVMERFAHITDTLFLISTHIVEAGEALQKRCDHVRFAYLPTVMEGSVPHYTYTLKEGITADRHGMMIIRNEKILDLLNSPQ